MAGGPRAGLLTHFYEKGERQLGAFFAAAFDSAQSAAFDSVCSLGLTCDVKREALGDEVKGKEIFCAEIPQSRVEQPLQIITTRVGNASHQRESINHGTQTHEKAA